MEVKYATKEIFEMLRKMDRKNNITRNREVKINKLKKGIRYPVVFAMLHKEGEIRVQFVANKEGDTFFQDMPVEFFDALPHIKVKKDLED
jgi:hypothetical protein